MPECPATRLFIGFKIAPGESRAKPPDRCRHAAGNTFADNKNIRIQTMHATIPAKTRGNRMGFINDQQRVVAFSQTFQAVMKSRLRQHHAGIGHHRFGQDGSHITALERCFHTCKIVELAGDCKLGEVSHLTQEARSRNRLAILQGHHRVIDCTVIAAVKNDDLAAPGHSPRHPQRIAVGIARRRRDLPFEITEPLAQQRAGFQRRPWSAACRSGRSLPVRELPLPRAVGEWPNIDPVSPRQKSSILLAVDIR